MRRKTIDNLIKRGTAIALVGLLVLGVGCGKNEQGSDGDSLIQSEVNNESNAISGSTGNTEGTGTSGTVDNSSSSSSDTTGLISTSVVMDEYDTVVSTENSTSSQTTIQFNQDDVSIDGSGCTESNGVLTISQPGTYVLSGTWNDGTVVVDTNKESVVNLVLNGVSINSSTSSAIFIKKAYKAVISLQEGTVNTLTDASNYVYADETVDEPAAALYAKCDLTINGTGTLKINANYNDAIKCNDSLKILSGTYDITSVDDGIIGKDMLVIEDGTFTINVTGDGLKASNDTDETLGFILINDGSFTITAGADGIQAETVLNINGGEFEITTGGGSAKATTQSDDWGWNFWGTSGTTTTEEESTSYKGIKAGVTLRITAGEFALDTCDDAIHGNGTVYIDGGNYTIATGDDGIHAESELTINGGTVTITKSYEGLESYVITLNNGTVSIVASDDGINAAGGTTSTTQTGWGFGGGMGASQGAALVINGGTLTVNAQGDGLDANGSVQVTGGTVFVDGPTNSGNGALDYDTTFEISGGTLAIAGSTGMAQAPSTSSTQASVSLTFTQTQAAGTTVTVYDKDGNEILSYAPSKMFQNIVLSSPEMTVGEDYKFVYGTTEIGTITLSDSVTYLQSNGTISSGASQGMGGMGGMGGFQGGGKQNGTGGRH